MSAERPRICVVNDNPEFLELISEILDGDAGYQVSLHDGAATPLAALREAQPKLIIVDLLLGGASGWEIVTLARADEQLADVPIIVCSADVAQLEERADELAAIGRVHVLRKPFGIEELTDLVGRLLGRAPAAGAAHG